ncbi:MAG: hypothetical protein MUO67_11770 [Anaerolineales bacterium]|nr:hypothetical protein [Anaerolineales bacterium]
MEGRRSGADGTDARIAQTPHHTADPGEEIQVLNKVIAFDRVSMERSIGKGNAVLVEVVAHRQFSAKGVPPFSHAELVEIVVTSLNQHRHIELGHVEGFYNSQLVAEVGQNDDDAVDLVGVLMEQVSAELGMFTRFDRPTRRRVPRSDHILVTIYLHNLEQLGAHTHGQFGIKEPACAHNQTKGSLFFHDSHFKYLLFIPEFSTLLIICQKPIRIRGLVPFPPGRRPFSIALAALIDIFNEKDSLCPIIDGVKVKLQLSGLSVLAW